ncbi:MAG: hypothetical protein PHU88_04815 [candidate division Zixibacteria bacterium]|nr:hypothetical protein [candidate division Zixibacteria bacterium]MDD5426143.1 hypothetical protein [candidate division Zixibacteria bacterium]
MKINTIGINAYQNLNHQSKTADRKEPDAASLPTPANLAKATEAQSSRLAIKAPSGSYADLLSIEEKQALEVLFSRFRDNNRFAAVGQAESDTGARENVLGRIIDIKV